MTKRLISQRAARQMLETLKKIEHMATDADEPGIAAFARVGRWDAEDTDNDALGMELAAANQALLEQAHIDATQYEAA